MFDYQKSTRGNKTLVSSKQWVIEYGEETKIKNEQRIEQLNAQIAKMKNVSECNKIKKATVKEKEYCRTRFLILHPEFKDE